MHFSHRHLRLLSDQRELSVGIINCLRGNSRGIVLYCNVFEHLYSASHSIRPCRSAFHCSTSSFWTMTGFKKS